MKMKLTGKHYCKFIIYVFLFLSLNNNLYANSVKTNGILIISSYNPETAHISKNISAFLDEYTRLGGKSQVTIENMNCGSFTDAYLWKGQMKNILNKYTSKKCIPDLIVLLGQEAWSAYLSQDKQVYEIIHQIPTMCGMVSRNAIILPDKTVSLEDWEPESIDMLKDVPRVDKMAGYVYKYDVQKNVQLIRDLYPKTKHLALVTDNTYGGVCLQALVKKEIKRFPGLDLILLDGRKNSIYTIVDRINDLPKNTVMLLGTWRVDKNNGYFMNNATYMMMGANPKIPAFSLTSIGLGYWAIGGCVPQYRTIGKDMALDAYRILKNDPSKKVQVKFIPNQFSFDVVELDTFKIDVKKLPAGAIFINEKPSFYEQNKNVVIGAFFGFSVILIGLLVTLYILIRTKRLKDELEVSESELRVAKEKAEESERLKTAFLANMTHEIRTPLNAIVGFSNVLAMGGSSQEEMIEYYKVIQSNSDLLLRLINDILDISSLEAGKLKFYYEECNVTSLCKEALHSVESICENPVKFILNSPDPNLYFVTDIHRLQQVLLNLISNSNKFTKEGSITLEFNIDDEKQMVIFTLTDTGKGILKGNEYLIFDRFKKLNDFVQGTGLGLAISKSIMNILGGDIWVDLSYKEGARFVFSHPVGLQPQNFIAK
ncbi:HAMP domain-containing sensor histidine kinase [uncultured Bacteroides sp.]|uniref:sensor histidine kinase n=1 Tax=uncultured Bacteroides sp. TaxID=162156 RepID=UPI002AAAE2F8|nr:HAMP domain-containing sensor histidine kinase [uncultured Bacteroides sp.]